MASTGQLKIAAARPALPWMGAARMGGKARGRYRSRTAAVRMGGRARGRYREGGRAGDRGRGRGNGIGGRARGRDIAIWRDTAARQYWLVTESDAERDGESEVEEELLDSVSTGFMFLLPSE
jgi:hypothetical protein